MPTRKRSTPSTNPTTSCLMAAATRRWMAVAFGEPSQAVLECDSARETIVNVGLGTKRRLADDQTSINNQLGGRFVVSGDQVVQLTHRDFAHLLARNAVAGQRRLGIGAVEDIVDANQGDVVRDAK